MANVPLACFFHLSLHIYFISKTIKFQPAFNFSERRHTISHFTTIFIFEMIVASRVVKTLCFEISVYAQTSDLYHALHFTNAAPLVYGQYVHKIDIR